MTSLRSTRNFIKMTPGSFSGNARAATAVNADTLGSLRRFPPGTMGGQLRTATPVNCNRPAFRVTDQGSGYPDPIADVVLLETGDQLLLETGDRLLLEESPFTNDEQVSQLAVNGDPGSDAILYIVTDPGGTPTGEATTIADLLTALED